MNSDALQRGELRDGEKQRAQAHGGHPVGLRGDAKNVAISPALFNGGIKCQMTSPLVEAPANSRIEKGHRYYP